MLDIPNHISFSNAFQIDVAYELFNRFDMKVAYKINNSKTSYLGSSDNLSSLLETPLLPKDRALINLAYSNKDADWLFDATWNYIGKSRIPRHESIDAEYSDPFSLINCQLTKKVNNFASKSRGYLKLQKMSPHSPSKFCVKRMLKKYCSIPTSVNHRIAESFMNDLHAKSSFFN